MNAFQELIKKAAPIMAAVQSLFFYVIILSTIGYFIDMKLKTFPILFIILLLIGLVVGFFQLHTLEKKGNR
tara:strand:- start:803 stop:1015 length:213 start_codon:yes stop_codon:yes gene_type:complete